MPKFRVHIKFKRGFEDWHVWDEPDEDACRRRFARGELHVGRKFPVEPASIVLADAVTVEEQTIQDKDKPYAMDEHAKAAWDESRQAQWEANNKAHADQLAAGLARGDFVPVADRIALAQARRAAQIRMNPGQLKHSDAQHVTQRAVLLAPGEEPPRGSRE
jgi:hypothetical protein